MLYFFIISRRLIKKKMGMKHILKPTSSYRQKKGWEYFWRKFLKINLKGYIIPTSTLNFWLLWVGDNMTFVTYIEIVIEKT